MAYLADTSLLITFNEASPIDYINGDVTVNGTYTTVPGKFQNALQLNQTYYDIDALNSLTTAFTIGFWLKSSCPGIVENPNTHIVQPLKIALFTKSDWSYSEIANQTTLTNEMFSVWEETRNNGTNALRVRIQGSTTATLTTAAYLAGLDHHFWIVYNGSDLRVYVDGELFTSTVSGTIPATLTASASHFYINGAIDGYGYETSRNLGILDDLVIFSTARTSKTDIFRAINLGAVYVADSSLCYEDEVYFGTIFDDTSTIQINSIAGNRGNIYVGRSDGKLLKGSRALWESRRDFSNTDESDCLDIITSSVTDNYSIQNGTLNITNAIIRV